MNKRPFVLRDKVTRQRAIDCISQAPDGYCAIVQEPTRNLQQNAAQWPILTAISQQLEWPVNGRMQPMSQEEWKDVLTAAFYKESPRVAASIDGMGVVMLGKRTREFKKAQFGEWLEFLNWFCADRGVNLTTEQA